MYVNCYIVYIVIYVTYMYVYQLLSVLHTQKLVACPPTTHLGPWFVSDRLPFSGPGGCILSPCLKRHLFLNTFWTQPNVLTYRFQDVLAEIQACIFSIENKIYAMKG